MHPIARFTALLALCGAALSGQTPAPAFEAASIKPADPAARGGGMGLSKARVHMINTSLKFCIQMAWNVKEFQVSGANGWMDSQHWDIDAVAAEPFHDHSERALLQTLLADRFGLVVHSETQERPGYILVAAKNGAKLPPPVEDPSITFSHTPAGEITFQAKSITLNQLASALAMQVGALIEDQTGISGKYDLSMEFAPDPTGNSPMNKGGMAPAPPPPAPDSIPGPTIFQALQDRFGLKLEAHKIPVEVIVVESAHRPSEN